jgi:hypothetical protein
VVGRSLRGVRGRGGGGGGAIDVGYMCVRGGELDGTYGFGNDLSDGLVVCGGGDELCDFWGGGPGAIGLVD